MIKVIDRNTISPINNDAQFINVKNVTFEFSEDEINLNFKIYFQYNYENTNLDNDLSISVNKENFKGKVNVITIFRQTLDTFFSEIYHQVRYDRVGRDDFGKSSRNVINIINFYIPEDYENDDPILIQPIVRCSQEGNITGADEYIQLETNPEFNNFGRDRLIEYDSRVASIVNKYHIKMNEIYNRMNICDTLSYLEIQVDLLTKIINKITSTYNIDTSEYKNLLDSIEKYNILNFKSEQKMISEIEKDKANIRKIQADYYDRLYLNNTPEE